MPVGYDRILSELGATDSSTGRNVLRALVLRLRRRIERNPRHPEVLLAEVGFGYRLAASPFAYAGGTISVGENLGVAICADSIPTR